MRFLVEKNRFCISHHKVAIRLAIIIMLVIIGGVYGVARLTPNENGLALSILPPSYDIRQINSPNTTTQDLNVLVVEINPRLNSVSGNPKVMDYFFEQYANAYPDAHQTVAGEKRGIAGVAVNEMIEDLNFASHGYFNINIVSWDYVNEFPRYKTAFTLPDGNSGYAFDEANYLMAAGDVGGVAGWQNMNNGCWFAGDKDCGRTTLGGVQAEDPPTNYSFDYRWLFDKLNIIGRRNNSEFDQLWLVGADPMMSYETVMVGRSGEAYWINGSVQEADCSMFMVTGASMSRRDAQLHAFNHAVENIMGGRSGTETNGVYPMGFNSMREATANTPAGQKPSYNVSTREEYLSLNLWERFMLNDYANLGTLNGVGNVHFPYNGTGGASGIGYDYANANNVSTTYLEWQDKSVDDMVGDFTEANSSAWMFPGSIYYVPNFANTQYIWNPGNAADRFYGRFWLYLLPHEVGYTEDGYLKNWWKYIYSLDYVKTMTPVSNVDMNVDINDNFSLIYEASYQSGAREVLQVSDNDVFTISDPTILSFSDGRFNALKEGNSSVTVWRDGKSIEYVVNVKLRLQYTITAKALPTDGGRVIGGGRYEDGTNVTLVAEPNEGYSFSHWDDDPSITSRERVVLVTGNATYAAVFKMEEIPPDDPANPDPDNPVDPDDSGENNDMEIEAPDTGKFNAGELAIDIGGFIMVLAVPIIVAGWMIGRKYFGQRKVNFK